jgi:GNAT superfamily N-acetyltransferase
MPATGLIMRNARPEELDKVALIIRDAYRQYEENVPASAWQAYLEDSMDVRSRLPASELIVAEIDGHLAGTVTFYPEAVNSYEDWPRGWALVRLLAVHPDYRGRGIGRALLEECIWRCRERGISTLALHTSLMMNVALRLYEKMGFRRVPEFDFHPTPDITVMAYILGL